MGRNAQAHGVTMKKFSLVMLVIVVAFATFGSPSPAGEMDGTAVCQPALKIDPGSASNFDPPVRRAVGAF